MASRLLFWVAGIVLVGAGILVLSVVRPNRVNVGLATNPRVVLVAVVGTPTNPGFSGFLAVLDPNSRNLTVAPVPGTLRGQKSTDPLWTVAASLPPSRLAHIIARDTHFRLSGYFVLDLSATNAVFQALASDTPGWPKRLTPDTTLTRLGWPSGKSNVSGELSTLQDIITYLPELPANQTALFHAVLKGSKTNLSLYQMFMLATYIRGDNLRLMPLTQARRLDP